MRQYRYVAPPGTVEQLGNAPFALGELYSPASDLEQTFLSTSPMFVYVGELPLEEAPQDDSGEVKTKKAKARRG